MPSHHRTGSHTHDRRLPPDMRHTDNSIDFSGSMSRAAWQLSIRLAKYCKGAVYCGTEHKNHPFNVIIPLHGPLLCSLTKEQNTNNGGEVVWHTEFTQKKYRHEIIRKFMHIHKTLLKKICRHYMNNCFHKRKNNSKVSLPLLREVITEELQTNKEIENKGDRVFLETMLAHEQIIAAIDALLVYLRTDVCLIRWCSEWCNELDMWTDEHAPLLALITPNANQQLPSYTTETKYCFRPKVYFGEEMHVGLQALRPEDLANIIKIQWESDIMKGNSYLVSHAPAHCLKYDGIVANREFIQDREWWIKMSKSENKKYQEGWKRRHPALKYDRMPVAYKSVMPPAMSMQLDQIQRTRPAMDAWIVENTSPDYNVLCTDTNVELGMDLVTGDDPCDLCGSRRCSGNCLLSQREHMYKDVNGRGANGTCQGCGARGGRCDCNRQGQSNNRQSNGNDGGDVCPDCTGRNGHHTKHCTIGQEDSDDEAGGHETAAQERARVRADENQSAGQLRHSAYRKHKDWADSDSD